MKDYRTQIEDALEDERSTKPSLEFLFFDWGRRIGVTVSWPDVQKQFRVLFAPGWELEVISRASDFCKEREQNSKNKKLNALSS